ncbi:MAG: PilZ domain-containing protein, partial [Sedimentisphaerales bacterium]|nr:PilZ domain-containing protein [Sedimentisphaerales bacterium]
MLKNPLMFFKKALGVFRSRRIFYRPVTGFHTSVSDFDELGGNMDKLVMPDSSRPRKILQAVIDEKVPAIMSYESKGKWHVAKVVVTGLGANRFDAEVLPESNKHPLNIQIDQPVGMSIKYGYGKFIFETKVVSLEPSEKQEMGGVIVMAVPDKVELVQRRRYFRVKVPSLLKVNVLLWHRSATMKKYKTTTMDSVQEMPEDYWKGRLVDLSAGGAQVVVDVEKNSDFKKGQFIGARFTPLPYETPLMFNAQIRNILPTADSRSICLG